ncbi:MAG: peptidoglycan-binding protein [Acidobacteria bacterium]|nr:peptidoglycan-binding protein [Acidobacteriota bacterium]MCL5287852.1 peptidoglycan-binding protein [Acidobacteriota bacterium]
MSATPFSIWGKPPQTKTPPAKNSSAPAPKKSNKPAKKRPPRPRAQKAPTVDRIREIQAALAHRGFYEGEPNGKWDARSVEAMKKFQSANELSVTGKFDAKSLQKLGLGSEVAGAAAPRPPMNDSKPQPPRP